MARVRVALAVALVVALVAVVGLAYINIGGVSISGLVSHANSNSQQSGAVTSAQASSIQIPTVVSNTTIYLPTTLALCQDRTGTSQASVTTTTSFGPSTCYLPPNQGNGGQYPTWTIGFNAGSSGLSATWQATSSGDVQFQVSQCGSSGCQTLYDSTNSTSGSYTFTQGNLVLHDSYQVAIVNFSGQNVAVTGSIVISG